MDRRNALRLKTYGRCVATPKHFAFQCKMFIRVISQELEKEILKVTKIEIAS